MSSLSSSVNSIVQEQHAQQWIQTQHNTFTNWCNTTIMKNSIAMSDHFEPMVDLIQGLYSGVNLMYLANQLATSSNKNNRHPVVQKENLQFNRRPSFRIQCIQNVQTALDMFQKDGLRFVNISANEICEGNLKLILGLVWTIIRHYESIDYMPSSSDTLTLDEDTVNSYGKGKGKGKEKLSDATGSVRSSSSSGDSHKEKLRLWIQSMTGIRPDNFTTSFKDGEILMKLVRRLQHDNRSIYGQTRLLDDDVNDSPILKTTKAMEAARDDFRVPIIMKPSDVVYSPDELSMMTYLICMNASIKEFIEKLDRDTQRQESVEQQQVPLRQESVFEAQRAPPRPNNDPITETLVDLPEEEEDKLNNKDYNSYERQGSDEFGGATRTTTRRTWTSHGGHSDIDNEYEYENEDENDTEWMNYDEMRQQESHLNDSYRDTTSNRHFTTDFSSENMYPTTTSTTDFYREEQERQSRHHFVNMNNDDMYPEEEEQGIIEEEEEEEELQFPPPPPRSRNKARTSTTTTVSSTNRSHPPPLPPKLASRKPVPHRSQSSSSSSSSYSGSRHGTAHENEIYDEHDEFFEQQQQQLQQQFGMMFPPELEQYQAQMNNMFHDEHQYDFRTHHNNRQMPPVPHASMYRHNHRHTTNNNYVSSSSSSPVTVTQTTRTVTRKVAPPPPLVQQHHQTMTTRTTNTTAQAPPSFVIVGDRRSMRKAMKRGVFIL